ncbi:MAG TPA: ATP-binding protein [Burkholderiales bacterium]|nr:ATP-binding protein [Burkholderiales bacterium]
MKLPQGVRSRLQALPAARGVLASVAVAVLVALLVFLYVKTQGVDIKRQNEVLSYFRELKEIDARWDVEVWRARTEAIPPPYAADRSTTLHRIQQELATAARDLDSPVLNRELGSLVKDFAEKADLMTKFRKANMAARQVLQSVMTADSEIAGLVRGAWQSFAERERLVAMESVVAQLLVGVQKYYFTPTEAHRKNLEALTADLRDAAPSLPQALRDGISRIDGNVRALLVAKPVEQELSKRLSFLTAGPRIDSLTGAFGLELEQTLSERERYRVYLIAYSGALLILAGYLAARLLASYHLLNKANLELEQRVADRTRELSEALSRLKESEAQLIQTEKMSSLGQMVAGIAHEVNTPLAYIKNSLGSVKGKLPELTQLTAECEKLLAMLRAGTTDPQQLSGQFALTQTLVRRFREHHAIDELQELVTDGLHGIGQISEIVTNLRNFSRLDRSAMASFNLNEGLESTLSLAKHEIGTINIKKQFGSVPPIMCSPSQINQVFLNLIQNAIQAIEHGQGAITLTTYGKDADYVVVEVEDTGKGIPPDVLPRIFDPFFTTKDIGKGTGLGLSIAYKIVEQHGGKIAVDSAVGAGTKFTVTLPLTPRQPIGLQAPVPA